MTYSIKDVEDFYVNGCKIDKFDKDETYTTFKSILQQIKNNNLSDDRYNLVSKYKGTFDLRPDVNSYSEVFIDILVKNNILNKVNLLTQRSLGLAHIQVRISEPGESYMPWHKDTYSYIEQNSGLAPAPIKLIYYLPEDDDVSSETKLQIMKGSHRCSLSKISKKYEITPGFDIFDRDVVMQNLECVNFNNTEYNFILFDTSCLHNVVKTNKKSVRVIYTFCTEYQFLNSFGSQNNKNRVNHQKTFNDFKVKNERKN